MKSKIHEYLKKSNNIMSKKTILNLSAIALLSISLTPTGCSDSQKSKTEKTHNHNAETVYQCPMKCEGEKTYSEMGKCPECGMDLKEAEHNH
jgi:hypothetical protein